MFFHCITSIFYNVFSLRVPTLYIAVSFLRSLQTAVIPRIKAQQIFLVFNKRFLYSGIDWRRVRTRPGWRCRDPKNALYRKNAPTLGRTEICTLKEKSMELHFICKSAESTLYFIMIFSYTLFDTLRMERDRYGSIAENQRDTEVQEDHSGSIFTHHLPRETDSIGAVSKLAC